MKDTPPTMTTTTKTTMSTTMNTLAPPTHELERQLRTLSLSGMAQTLLARNQEAISHHLAYTEFLELLVSDEFARRRDRLFSRRLKAARVPQLKTLESFRLVVQPADPQDPHPGSGEPCASSPSTVDSSSWDRRAPARATLR